MTYHLRLNGVEYTHETMQNLIIYFSNVSYILDRAAQIVGTYYFLGMIWFSQIFHFPSYIRYVRTTSKFTRQALILSGKNLAWIIHWIDSCLSKWFELDHACIGQVLQRSSKCNYVLEVCVWMFNHEKKKTLPRVLSLGYGWNRSAKNNDH